MTTWTADELARIGQADELRIAALRADDSLRRPTTIWVVADGDELYVRSAHADQAAWWRATRVRHQGHISAGGIERDVTFAEVPDPDENDRIDAAYRAKYRRYPAAYTDAVVNPEARATTIRLVPLDGLVISG